MLIRFSVRNHLSLRDTQELSLVASTLNDKDTGLLSTETLPDCKLLSSLVVYGANASGKSNVLEALRFMQQSVLYSQVSRDSRGGVPRRAFALDSNSKNDPSLFEIEFDLHDERYRYGFEASSEAFLSEWLYSFPNGRQTRLFVRRHQEFEFSRNFRGRNKTIAELTRPNSLFLSAAAQSNHSKAGELIEFFRFIFMDRDFWSPNVNPDALATNGGIDKRCIDFLGRLGTGVVSARTVKPSLTEEQKRLNKELFVVIKKHFSELSSKNIDDMPDPTKIELGHQGLDNEIHYLDLQMESAGTKRLLSFLGIVFKALDNGGLVVVDEMDASLHTKATEAVLSLFESRLINKKGAQLIATVHDTNLLKSDLLRRDQIWFTEKDNEGASFLYPLTDLSTRQSDNIEKGYLQGRYGAVPYSGDVDLLFSSFGDSL